MVPNDGVEQWARIVEARAPALFDHLRLGPMEDQSFEQRLPGAVLDPVHVCTPVRSLEYRHGFLVFEFKL
jgi:hypothetical protein